MKTITMAEHVKATVLKAEKLRSDADDLTDALEKSFERGRWCVEFGKRKAICYPNNPVITIVLTRQSKKAEFCFFFLLNDGKALFWPQRPITPEGEAVQKLVNKWLAGGVEV